MKPIEISRVSAGAAGEPEVTSKSSFLIDMTCPVLCESMRRFRKAWSATAESCELGRYADAEEHYWEAAAAAIDFASAVRDHMKF